ncbi:MAG: hypothetical protein ACXW5U_16575 [Thermoanaerobaculia bacterium]
MKEKREIYRFLHVRAILEKVLHPILFVGPERAGERIVVGPEDVHRVVS